MSAHGVSAHSADYIAEILNKYRFHLKDGEVWHVYEIDRYDQSFDIAESQSFKVYRGSVREYSRYA